jgi:hypothetical protein
MIHLVDPRSVVGLSSAVQQTEGRRQRIGEGTETETSLAVAQRRELGGNCPVCNEMDYIPSGLFRRIQVR